jgi:hypothetical protein
MEPGQPETFNGIRESRAGLGGTETGSFVARVADSAAYGQVKRSYWVSNGLRRLDADSAATSCAAASA